MTIKSPSRRTLLLLNFHIHLFKPPLFSFFQNSVPRRLFLALSRPGPIRDWSSPPCDNPTPPREFAERGVLLPPPRMQLRRGGAGPRPCPALGKGCTSKPGPRREGSVPGSGIGARPEGRRRGSDDCVSESDGPSTVWGWGHMG